jgi:hypothetical protein
MVGVVQGSSIKRGQPETIKSINPGYKWALSEDAKRAILESTHPPKMEPIAGDILPQLGEQVLIHLARQDQWVPHIVVGYYVWPGLDEPTAFRVNIRVRDEQGYLNARSLEEVRKLDGSWFVPRGPKRNADAPILA